MLPGDFFLPFRCLPAPSAACAGTPFTVFSSTSPPASSQLSLSDPINAVNPHAYSSHACRPPTDQPKDSSSQQCQMLWIPKNRISAEKPLLLLWVHQNFLLRLSVLTLEVYELALPTWPKKPASLLLKLGSDGGISWNDYNCIYFYYIINYIFLFVRRALRHVKLRVHQYVLAAFSSTHILVSLVFSFKTKCSAYLPIYLIFLFTLIVEIWTRFLKNLRNIKLLHHQKDPLHVPRFYGFSVELSQTVSCKSQNLEAPSVSHTSNVHVAQNVQAIAKTANRPHPNRGHDPTQGKVFES